MARPVATTGRGAVSNRESTRFPSRERDFCDLWLNERLLVDGTPAAPRTSVTIERPRSIIARNTSPDIGFDRSINPYRGCEHGCIYCFARPTHAFHDLSPGLDFETRLFAKPNAAALLRVELAKKSYDVAPMALGTNTDPYQPIEGRYGITRSIIEVLSQTRHPSSITTKSDRVVRDLDLLGPMAADGLAAVAISLTSLDAKVSRTLEPRAPSAAKRLAAVRTLSAAGVPTFVAIAPIIPAITDHELEHIIEAAAKAGARGCFYVPLRLPHEIADLFKDWLQAHYPDRADKVMAIVRSIRDGRDNDPGFFTRMRGSGPWADLLRTRFKIAMRKNGLSHDYVDLRRDLFRAPEGAQMRLF